MLDREAGPQRVTAKAITVSVLPPIGSTMLVLRLDLPSKTTHYAFMLPIGSIFVDFSRIQV